MAFHGCWYEERLGAIEEQIRALDFFGWALENTPIRDQFWTTYRLLAEALFSLKDALALRSTSGHGRIAQSKAMQHIKFAADLLLRIMSSDILRQHPIETEDSFTWLDRFASNDDSERTFDELWEGIFRAYTSVFERVRLVHVACPTGEMDQ